MKKSLLVLGTVVVLATLVYSQREDIITRVMESGIEARIGTDIVSDLHDGLHVGLCGAGGPLPAPKASGPCVIVVAGKQTFMVDSGTDGTRNLARMGFQAGNLDAVLLTHFHSDHQHHTNYQ